jgi:hypothetical protein
LKFCGLGRANEKAKYLGQNLSLRSIVFCCSPIEWGVVLLTLKFLFLLIFKGYNSLNTGVRQSVEGFTGMV